MYSKSVTCTDVKYYRREIKSTSSIWNIDVELTTKFPVVNCGFTQGLLLQYIKSNIKITIISSQQVQISVIHLKETKYSKQGFVWYISYFHWSLFVCLFGCLFVCLFDCFGVLLSNQEFFTHMETSSLPVKGCKMVISENPCHSHLFLSVFQWGFHYPFRSVASGFEHPIFCMQGERSNRL